MTFEERVKQILADQVWGMLTLAQRLEEAQEKIKKLEAKENLTEPEILSGQ